MAAVTPGVHRHCHRHYDIVTFAVFITFQAHQLLTNHSHGLIDFMFFFFLVLREFYATVLLCYEEKKKERKKNIP